MPPIIKIDQRLLDIKAIPPIDAPIAKEPESPINNFAGYLFRKRKPIQAPAIIMQRGASVSLVFGFSILVLSNFIPTIYFGIFTGIAMLLAMISVLTLLPSLLLVFKPFDYKDN